jgi:hypothetical protein
MEKPPLRACQRRLTQGPGELPKSGVFDAGRGYDTAGGPALEFSGGASFALFVGGAMLAGGAACDLPGGCDLLP